MFIKIFLFFLLPVTIFAIDVTVSLGNNGKQSYSLVEVVSEDDFRCEHIKATHIRRDYIICEFKKIPLSRPISTENSFFKIRPYVKNRQFFLEVVPKFSGELYSQTIKTLDNKEVYKKKVVDSNTWLILGFEGKNPFFKSRDYEGINFPVKIKEWDYPTIGALDIGGFPISKGKDYNDFVEYNEFKRLFNKKDYRNLLERIDRKLEKKEINKLFMPEILAFKIKVLEEEGGRDREIIETGAPWIKAYTSHKDLPEIMLTVAKAYLDLGIVNEANSILDSLIIEYPGNSYAEYAMIYRADRWAKEGKTGQAKSYYDKVLYSSDDLDVASLAADKLARYYIVRENIDKAAELYKKIIDTNPTYFLKDFDKTYNLARELVDRKLPDISAQLGEILYKSIDITNKNFQQIVLDSARWYREAGDLKKSLEFYDVFLINYSYVKNIMDIRKEIDYIKFDLDKGNSEERLKLYDYITGKYPNEDIAQYAKYKKMEILIQEKKYSDVRDYLGEYEQLDEKLFPNLKEEVRRVARKLIKFYLDKEDCEKGVELVHKYKILLPDSYDVIMSDCGNRVADYDLVINLSNKYINSESPADSLSWRRKKVDALYGKSDYIEFLLEAARVTRMDRALKNPPDKELFFKLFKGYLNNGNEDMLLPTLENIKEYFPKEPRILDLYKVMAEVAMRNKNYKDAEKYATLILNQQRIMNVTSFSPFVEFTIADAGVELKSYSKGIDVLETLITQELNLDDRFQGNYKLGNLYELNNNSIKAQERYKKCSEIEGESKWKELCKSKLQAK